MANILATFLINDLEGTETFVINLPEDYPLKPTERLVTRSISEEEYLLLKEEKQDHLKIYRFVDDITYYKDMATSVPKRLDYKTGLNTRLHHKPFFSPNGFLTKMEYYQDISYDPIEEEWKYHDLILEATFDYQIDPKTEYVISRTKTVGWYKEDGTLHPDLKSMYKVYTVLEMDEVAIKRRSNVIAILKVEIAQFISWMVKLQYPDPKTRPNSNAMSKQVMSKLSIPIMNYINGGDRSIITVIQNSTDSFMNTVMPKHNKTVRDYLVGYLTEYA